MELTYEIVDVTPALATEWLGHNRHNRHLRQQKIAEYARDMAAGDWPLNGETVKFDDQGTLIDGQHRLHAVVKSGQTIRFLVVRGLPSDAQETVDIGLKRQAQDALKLRGHENSALLAGLARRAITWDRYQRASQAWATSATLAEVMAYVDAHPALFDSAQFASKAGRSLPLPRSLVALLHWLFAQRDQLKAEEFFYRLVDGADLSSGHPILTLKNTVQRMTATPGRRVTDEAWAVMFIRAWNAWRENRKLELIRLQLGTLPDGKVPPPI